MVKIVTDSVASIPAEVVRERDIEVVSLFVNRDGREYREADMDVDAFYEDIADMIDNPPTSSQPSQHAMETIFEKAAQAADEVLGVFISSKMSGTFEGAVRSARACKERYKQFRCTLIDSTSNCGDEMFAVLDACDARDAGGDLTRCAQAAIDSVVSSRFIFAPESLAFLKAGGRIGGASALLGGLLQISPVLTVADWETSTLAKVRTWKKTLARMVRRLQRGDRGLRAQARGGALHRIGGPRHQMGARGYRAGGGTRGGGAARQSGHRRSRGAGRRDCL